MSQAQLRVVLLEASTKALDLIWRSYRQCYSSRFAPELKEVPDEEKERFIKEMVKRGHHSPLEHVKFTFAIEGISRACSHQLVRHRIASYSQQSQRYVDMSQFKYVVPPSIAKVPEALEEFQRVMEEIRKGYRRIKDILQAHGLNSERANEDARFLLPQAVETKIIVTMNVRELLHFFSQRLCSRAQWEIRELAKRMLEECKKVLPAIFEEAGPKCVILGYCPENQQSCGFYLSRNL
jgi:thymidylate synthase (FAD)